ncbi:MAG: metal ABC transporter ATP-binding protein [Candidatus Schekmanbacteria bacterium]|nr:metal ABC transporter ATP-binding protein [Candidatus Schekmanbacteria bacterium]
MTVGAGVGAAAPPLIEVRAVTVRHGAESVIDRVSIDFARAEIHAIIGPNGGGKTTLLRALLGQVPFTGEIRAGWRASGRIGYVPQRLRLGSALPITVAEFLFVAAQRRPLWSRWQRLRPDPEVAPLLRRLQLDHLLGRRLFELSGGERQRVVLLQALVPLPELLLLDGPAGGIDRVGLEAVESMLQELPAQGVTAILVTHDLDQVMRISQRVTCLHHQVRFSGPPAAVLTDDRVLSAFRPAELVASPVEAPR